MAECERCKTLEAALQDERRLLQRKLGEVEHHETRSHAGQWENAFAAAHLPDWEIRQRLEAIDAALAAQPAPCSEPDETLALAMAEFEKWKEGQR